eukprot:TRINITY_DN444_c1_g1_i1.p1 TRINITY_DN444_c1_g1~~TRINITY_DN444_c1_g1_i1.p1  ORF type:complete len:1073 (-),score=258.84 TRINITY_DN444_c1_g1_i1:24-3242(-)
MSSPGGFALLIGNSAYADAALANPCNDVDDLGKVLKETIGFNVRVLKDGSHRQMKQQIIEFTENLTPGAPVIFYYSGHGMQSQGENYLVPIGAVLSLEADMPYECIPMTWVLGRMSEASKLAPCILIFDACRNNPFARKFRSIGGGGGLTVVNAPVGCMIGFATAPGEVALDSSSMGGSRNSPYASALLKHIPTPDLDAEIMFRRVRSSVHELTQGQQVPWNSTSLTCEVTFMKSSAVAAAAGVATKPSASSNQQPPSWVASTDAPAADVAIRSVTAAATAAATDALPNALLPLSLADVPVSLVAQVVADTTSTHSDAQLLPVPAVAAVSPATPTAPVPSLPPPPSVLSSGQTLPPLATFAPDRLPDNTPVSGLTTQIPLRPMARIQFRRRDEPFFELSSFFQRPTMIDGKLWPTVLHFMQAAKFSQHPQLQERIRTMINAQDALQFARTHSSDVRSDWESVKDDVMYHAVAHKFSVHTDLNQLLLATGAAYIVESSNNKTDAYWGDGSDGSGLNMGGKLLMKIRRQLWERGDRASASYAAGGAAEPLTVAQSLAAPPVAAQSGPVTPLSPAGVTAPVTAAVTAPGGKRMTSDDLLKAVNKNSPTEVRQILESGVNPDWSASNGATAIHTACALGHTEVVEVLLQHGVDIKSAPFGKTPIQYAQSSGHTAIVRLLESHGAAITRNSLPTCLSAPVITVPPMPSAAQPTTTTTTAVPAAAHPQFHSAPVPYAPVQYPQQQQHQPAAYQYPTAGSYPSPQPGVSVPQQTQHGSINVLSRAQYRCTSVGQHSGMMLCVKFDEHKLFCGGEDPVLKIFSRQNLAVPYSTLRGHQSSVRCVDFDLQRAVSGAADARMILWDWRQGQSTAVISSHVDELNCVSLHGTTLWSSSDDKTTKAHDLRTNACAVTLTGHSNQVYKHAVEGMCLLTASTDQSSRLWDIRSTSQPLHVFRMRSVISHCHLDASEIFLACNGYIGVFDRNTYEERTGMDVLTMLRTAHLPCKSLVDVGLQFAFAADQTSILSGQGKHVVVINRQRREAVRLIEEHHKQVYALQFNSNELATVSFDGRVTFMEFSA